MKKLLAIAALLISSSALADVSLDVTTVSKHFGTNPRLNENNFGVGLKIGKPAIYATLGTFSNSHFKQSQYVGLGTEYELRDTWKRLRFGIAGGLVRGYKGTRGEMGTQVGDAQLFALPYVEFGGERSATRLGLLGNAVTLQLTFKLTGGAR